MEYQEPLNEIICILQQIQRNGADNTLDIIQAALAVIACVLAWFIPKRIMWEQTYSSLMSDYRSYDFGVAVQGIVEFFAVDCKYDVKKIKEAYERRFVRDVYGLDWDSDLNGKFSLETVREKLKGRDSARICAKSPELCLHYQRRLLAQFYYQLDLCARTPFIGKRRMRRDFTSREASIGHHAFMLHLEKQGSTNASALGRYWNANASKPYMEM